MKLPDTMQGAGLGELLALQEPESLLGACDPAPQSPLLTKRAKENYSHAPEKVEKAEFEAYRP